MKALEIDVNGQHKITAGIGDDGVLLGDGCTINRDPITVNRACRLGERRGLAESAVAAGGAVVE